MSPISSDRSRLTIWCSAQLPESDLRLLREGIGGHELRISDSLTGNLRSTGPSHDLPAADVAFGQPDPDQICETPRLRWVHLTSAGYTRYDRADIRAAFAARGAALSNSSGVYNEPCAQHLLAFMLAMARELPRSLEVQIAKHEWANDRLRNTTRLLSGRILLLGYGAIIRRLAELLAPFRADLVALRRRVQGDEPISVRPIDELDSLLPQTDHLVNALPQNASTDHILGSPQFDLIKPGAILYNVGRGTTVDQAALIAALESGRLGGAYLDVTDPEPLPSDHPLWQAPNCYITPHIAGGYVEESTDIVRHFLDNLRRFEAGEPLEDRVF